MFITKRFVPTIAVLLMYASFIATLIAPSIAVAQEAPQPTSPAYKGKPLPRFINPVEAKVLEQVNLTPSQKQKIQDLNQKYQSQIEQVMQSNQEAFKEFRQMMDGDTATDEQIREKHRQIQEFSQQMSSVSIEHQLAVRNILTPEQRKQKAAIMNNPAKMQEIIKQVSSERKLQMQQGGMSK